MAVASDGSSDGGEDARAALNVALADINLSDMRFQFRLSYSTSDIAHSLQANGQLVPVLLWGSKPPFTVIDGFRRLEAARQLGWTHVSAIRRTDLDEKQAFCVAFVENSKRKGLTVWDRASAVLRARDDQAMSKEDIAREFEISVRQVERYLELLAFAPDLQAAVRGGSLTLAHAAVLQRLAPASTATWIPIVNSENLSAAQLQKRLLRGRRARPRRYLAMAEGGGGFRMFAFSFQSDCDEVERTRLERALRQALAIVGGRSAGRGSE